MSDLEVASKGINFESTIYDPDFESRIQRSPLKIFLDIPLSSIRERCVSCLEQQVDGRHQLPPGSEERWEEIISALVKSRAAGKWEDGKFAARMLGVYVGLGKTTLDCTKRAFQFAIDLYNSHKSDPKSFVLEMVPPVLFKQLRNYYFWSPTYPPSEVAIGNYRELIGLGELLENELKWVPTYGEKVKAGHYEDSDWTKTCRALRIINMAGDFRFLAHVRNLLTLLSGEEPGCSRPQLFHSVHSRAADFYQQAQHVTILRCMVDSLEKIQAKDPKRFE